MVRTAIRANLFGASYKAVFVRLWKRDQARQLRSAYSAIAIDLPPHAIS
jgi:hypothetical protein